MAFKKEIPVKAAVALIRQDDVLAAAGYGVIEHPSQVDFTDNDALGGYVDLVRYVEIRYYLGVSRYTTSGFMRLKLGRESEKRRVFSSAFETGRGEGQPAKKLQPSAL